MQTKLTFKSVRAALALDFVTIRKDNGGEYLIRIKGSPKGEGYFTSSLQDALDTGHMISMNAQNRTLSGLPMWSPM